MQNFVRRKPGIYRGLGFYRRDRREHREKGFLPPRSQRTPEKNTPILETARRSRPARRSLAARVFTAKIAENAQKSTSIVETARRRRRARRLFLAARVFTAKIAKNAQKKTLPFLKPLGAFGVLGGYSWRPGFLPPRSQRTPRKKLSHS